VAYLAPITRRVLALLTDGAGSEHVIPAGRFRVPAGDVATCEPDACERAVSVDIGRSRALSGISSRLDGRDLRQTEVTVRVGYRLVDDGTLDQSVDASALGGADALSIDERASVDAHAIVASLSSLVNLGATDPAVLDLAADEWFTENAQDRVILLIPFVLTTRASFPGTYGPAAT
jgi:hypothetical protein